MRDTPPFCAQAMAESVGPPFNKFGADAAEADDEELLDEELLDEEELVDDDGLLRGTEGRPSSRRAKKAAARSELITIRSLRAKSAYHCAFVFAHHGIVEPTSGGAFFALPGADTPRSRCRMRESRSLSAGSRSSGADSPTTRGPAGALIAR